MTAAPAVHVVPAGDAAWEDWLNDVPRDVYHLGAYHSYAAGSGEGDPYLIVVGNRDHGLAWPYLLREIEETDATDVGCVYGYPGPLAWGVSPEDPFLALAWREITATWRSQRAVAAFTRFNPILGNAALARAFGPGTASTAGLQGAVIPHGQTVSLDCTLDDDAACALYNRTLRQQIAATRRAGLTTSIDETWADVGAFVRLYRASMERHDAPDSYYVDEDDVLRLREALGEHLHLMVTRVDGEVAAAALNTEFGGIVQAHLIGINHEFRKYSPQKLLTDDLRRWAHKAGASVLHLGGGLGGAEDSLFAFKKRFSPRRHAFHTGRWILDVDTYRAITELRGCAVDEIGTGYFPSYRAPVAALPT